MDHPEGCDCGEGWRHRLAEFLDRQARIQQDREERAVRRKIGVDLRNERRLRHVRSRETTGGDDAQS